MTLLLQSVLWGVGFVVHWFCFAFSPVQTETILGQNVFQVVARSFHLHVSMLRDLWMRS